MIVDHVALEGSFCDAVEQPTGKQVTPSKISLFSVAKQTFQKCLDTLEKKNHDYSKGVDEFRNFKLITHLRPRLSVEDGIIVRLCDKFMRVSNLLDSDAKVKDETIEDTIDDAINYFVILKAYLKNKNL